MESVVTPRYHLITYGCQMNKNDSERAAALLEQIGFSATESPEDADFILINTCSVRQSAEDRLFGQVHNFGEMKEKRPRLLLGVTGCMPGRDRDGKLRAKLPMVDFFFPITDLPQLPRWIAEHEPQMVHMTDAPDDYLKITPTRSNGFQAFVTIQTGCNKFCTYCVVPWSRGLERNRPVADLLTEVQGLAKAGTVEVTLLGQTVNSYRAPDPENFSANNPFHDHFAALLWEVNQISGIERIHFTAPHPIHMTDEVIAAMALPKHVRYIHLPVQAGDDEVLRRMNRRYTAAQYLEIVQKIRAQIPDIALGTDIIVGFAGETAEQFDKTVSLYQAADFDISYTAQYSPRSGTVAYKAFSDSASRDEKKRRWEVLQKLMEETVLRKNQAYVGKQARVLVETVSEKGIAEGNSEHMKRVRFGGATQTDIGRFVDVRIEKAREWILDATVVPAQKTVA